MKITSIYKDIKIKPTNFEVCSVLEIGPGEGKFANFLAENGVSVTAIDTKRFSQLNELVKFEEIKFEDFNSEKVFDLVHARNVVPFFSNKKEQLKRMLKMGKFVYFTFFGPHDPWASRGLTIEKDELLSVITNEEILYVKEEEFVGLTMNGEYKPWHIFTYLHYRTNVRIL